MKNELTLPAKNPENFARLLNSEMARILKKMYPDKSDPARHEIIQFTLWPIKGTIQDRRETRDFCVEFSPLNDKVELTVTCKNPSAESYYDELIGRIRRWDSSTVKPTAIGGNGAGRKPATEKEREAKLKLLDLTERLKPDYETFEQAVGHAYGELTEEEQFLLPDVPTWNTVRGWRKYRKN